MHISCIYFNSSFLWLAYLVEQVDMSLIASSEGTAKKAIPDRGKMHVFSNVLLETKLIAD